MKIVSLLNLFIILIFVGCGTTQPQENNSSGGIAFPPQFLEKRVRDLRTLILSQKDIDFLAKNQMCSVRLSHNISSARPIPVGNGLKLSGVILLYHGKPYDGQVKVVSQNSIVQTSIETYDPSEQGKIEVNPGDLVFLGARD